MPEDISGVSIVGSAVGGPHATVTNTRTTSGTTVADVAELRRALAELTSRLRTAELPGGPEPAERAEQLDTQMAAERPNRTLRDGLLSTLEPRVAVVASLATSVAVLETRIKTLLGIG